MNSENKTSLTYDVAGAGVAHIREYPCKIPRNKVGDFCESLNDCTTKLFGVVFYYPDLDSGINTCRFEWMVSQGSTKYAIRLGIQFRVDAGDLERIWAYMSYGNGHPLAGKTPNLSDQEKLEFGSQIETVINEARAATNKQFVPVTYLKIAQGMCMALKNATSILGCTIMPTAYVPEHRSFVSPLICQVEAPSLEVAKRLARQRNGLICALLTLITSRTIEEYGVSWKDNTKIEALDSVAHLPEPAKLFPSGSLGPFSNYVDLTENLEQKIRWIAQAYEALDEEWRELITNAIYAYGSGLKIRHQQPTMSAVAFVAALSPLVTITKCKGSVSCSECGSRPSHNLRGDAISIAESIRRMRGLAPGSDTAKQLQDLIKEVYGKQRSAYVHDAVLRHAEKEHKHSPASSPTNNDLVPDELRYGYQLDSVSSLARESLIMLVAEKSNREVDYTLFPFELNRVSSKVAMTMEITCPGDATVGFQ